MKSNCAGSAFLAIPNKFSPSYSLLTAPTARPPRASAPRLPRYFINGVLPKLHPTREWAAKPAPFRRPTPPIVGRTTEDTSRIACAASFSNLVSLGTLTPGITLIVSTAKSKPPVGTAAASSQAYFGSVEKPSTSLPMLRPPSLRLFHSFLLMPRAS